MGAERSHRKEIRKAEVGIRIGGTEGRSRRKRTGGAEERGQEEDIASHEL